SFVALFFFYLVVDPRHLHSFPTRRLFRSGPEPSPGTVAFSLSGNVARPGNYELELGTGLRELIYDLGGGIPDGRELKAIIPGGSDRKSTRLNSSHLGISYAVFCLKKKNTL